MANTQTIRGTIQTANERGIKVAGEWYNWSKFGPEADPFLEVGGPIELTVDGAGWIKSYSDSEAAPEPQPAPKRIAVTNGKNGNFRHMNDGPDIELPRPAAPSTAAITKDQLIVRQVAIKAAADLASAGRIQMTDLMDTAQAMESWVLRGVIS